MKVKFLRKYGNYKIDEVVDAKFEEEEKKYLISTGTVEVLEDDIVENSEETEEIPEINAEIEETSTEKKGNKNGTKGKK